MEIKKYVPLKALTIILILLFGIALPYQNCSKSFQATTSDELSLGSVGSACPNGVCPEPVAPSSNQTRITLGRGFACGLTDLGKVRCVKRTKWMSGADPAFEVFELSIPTKALAIAGSTNSLSVLGEDNQLYLWDQILPATFSSQSTAQAFPVAEKLNGLSASTDGNIITGWSDTGIYTFQVEDPQDLTSLVFKKVFAVTDILTAVGGGKSLCALKTTGTVTCVDATGATEPGEPRFTMAYNLSSTGHVRFLALLGTFSQALLNTDLRILIDAQYNGATRVVDFQNSYRSPALSEMPVHFSIWGEPCATFRNGKVDCLFYNTDLKISEYKTIAVTDALATVSGLGPLHCAYKRDASVVCWGEGKDDANSATLIGSVPFTAPVEVLNLKD